MLTKNVPVPLLVLWSLKMLTRSHRELFGFACSEVVHALAQTPFAVLIAVMLTDRAGLSGKWPRTRS